MIPEEEEDNTSTTEEEEDDKHVGTRPPKPPKN